MLCKRPKSERGEARLENRGVQQLVEMTTNDRNRNRNHHRQEISVLVTGDNDNHNEHEPFYFT